MAAIRPGRASASRRCWRAGTSLARAVEIVGDGLVKPRLSGSTSAGRRATRRSAPFPTRPPHALSLRLRSRRADQQRGLLGRRLRVRHADRRRAAVPAAFGGVAHQRAGGRRRGGLRRFRLAGRRPGLDPGDGLCRLRHRLSRRGRDHEGRRQRARPQHRGDAVVLGRGRGGGGRRTGRRGRAADRVRDRRQHAAAGRLSTGSTASRSTRNWARRPTRSAVGEPRRGGRGSRGADRGAGGGALSRRRRRDRGARRRIVEIVATLVATSVVPEELDAVVAAIETAPASRTPPGRARCRPR